MKKLYFLLAVLSALLTSCGPTKDDAIKFNDQLVTEQKSCLKAEADFYDACATYDATEIHRAYETLKEQVNSSHQVVSDMKSSEKFEAFKKSALDLIGTYKDMMDKEFSEYANLYSIPDEDFTDANQRRSQQVADIINDAVNTSNDAFLKAQETFSAEWDFTLKEN